jgi:mono/diheme cytochrome c family protein
VIAARFVRGLALALAFAGVLASAHEVRPDNTSVAGGAAVFSKYCALCHGSGGTGNGRAAAMQKVPPADLTVSTRSRSYKLQIVRGGGAELGRSSSMPSWRDVLSDAEIADVVEYIETLNPAGNK